MNKPELIEIITSKLGIPDAEHKHFFEMLLKRCSEVLEANQSIVTSCGRFEIHKAIKATEADQIIFTTNENEKLLFDIPDKEEENFSIDSYFSLSLGKPVIPRPGSDENEFFIPHSNSEMKRLMELKVDRFIEEHTGKEQDFSEPEHEEDISGVQFSFLNWKKASTLNKNIEENIKNLEEELASDFIEAEDETNLPEIKEETEPEMENIVDEADEIHEEDFSQQIESEEINEETAEKFYSLEEIESLNDEFSSDSEKPEEIKIDSFEEKIINEEVDQSEFENSTNSIPAINEKEISQISIEEKAIVENDLARISEAFKFAEEKKTRLDGYKKRSYGGFIFASVLIAIVAAVIYFSYYFSGTENSGTTEKQIIPKEFIIVVERAYDIPVTYPNDSVTSTVYDAINDQTIFQKPDVLLTQQKNIGDSNYRNNLGEVEIKNPLPAKKIKGYIYQYDDGMIAVQVSSWKAKSIAISETQKYRNAGYNAFAEQTEVSGEIYYRVRIGGFKSVSEAEEFLNK